MFSIVQLPLLQQRFMVDDRTLMVTIEVVDSEKHPGNVDTDLDPENLDGNLSDEDELVDADLIEQHDEDSMIDESSLMNTADLDAFSPQPGDSASRTVTLDSDNNEQEVLSSGGTEDDENNPLLVDDSTEVDPLEVADTMSVISSEEFIPTAGELNELDSDDPCTILTWNSSGLSEEAVRNKVWGRFVHLVESSKPDIVVFQNVKLCESEMTGLCPKVIEKGDGRSVHISYEQKMRDGKLLLDLSRGVFKNYHKIQSLACWKIGGQLVYIKKRFQCLKERYNLNMKISPKYHHPEGRSIMLQFKSYYLLCLMSPSNGWTAVNVKQRRQWDRQLAHLLYDSKDAKAVILCGNLNCAPEDIDLSDPEKLKLEKSPAMHESGHSGYPGCRQSDRDGFKWIMQAGRLTDAFRSLHPYSGKDSEKVNLQYTTLAYLGDKTRCAVRTNLTLVSKYFMKNVVRCDILGKSIDLSPSGWRHMPQKLVMRPPENDKT